MLNPHTFSGEPYFARVLKRDTLTVDDIHKWNCEHWKDGFIYFNEYEVDLR